MLEVAAVSYTYAGHGQDTPPALHDVTLSFAPGQMVALLGHNGSGKSTLAKLLSGVLKPQHGHVVVDGADTLDSAGIWEARRRVGLVFQNPDDQLVTNTVIDDIAFGPENLGLPRAEIQKRLDEVVTLLDLDSYLHVPVNELSVGQKQRVAIAGVLAMQPRYLVLDEPSSMLPPRLAGQLLATVERLAREREIGVIYITHYMDEAARFDRLVVVDSGHIALDGTPRDIFCGATAQMRALHLDIPLATDMAQRLQRRGVSLRTDVLTPGELVDALRPYATARTTPHALTAAPTQPLAPGATLLAPAPEPAQEAAEAALEAHWPVETTPEDTRGTGDARDEKPPILETRHLSHTHLKGTPFAQVALVDLTTRIHPGSFVAVVGPTRSGKSTFADCLNGLIRAGREMVLFHGQDIAAQGFDMDRLRAQVGVVFQSPETQIFNDIVGKDVAFGPKRQKVSLEESRRRVRESLEAVGLPYEEFRNRYTYALSGGQKRRVAIAGVLAMEPAVLVLDEPTAGLDPAGRREFLALVASLHRERGLTVVYLTASLEDVVGLAEYVYIVDAGQVAFEGTVPTVLRRLADLDKLNINLSSSSRLALALQAVFPDLPTTCLDANELEAELLRRLPVASPVAGDEGHTRGDDA